MLESGEPSRAYRRARTVVVLAVLITVVLYVVPYGEYIGYPLMLLSTFAHEMGHGLAAILVGGEFEKFQMWSDGSGMATTRGNFGRLARATVAAGGLVGPAVLGAIFFILASRQKVARIALLLFGAAMLFCCVWVVRGLFAWGFVGVVGAICLVLAYKAPPAVSQGVVAFLASQMALAVFSRGDYLFTAEAVTATGTSPSDVSNMADALFLPYWFWGAVCGLFSVLVLVGGLWLFFRATRGDEPKLSMAGD